MCKEYYSINKENKKEYRDYLNWLAEQLGKQPENPYIDPDSNYKNPKFYQDLCLFLNKREQELEQKLCEKNIYYFNENDKEIYGIQVKEIVENEEKLVFYLKSDQFGFSRPSEDERKYIFDVYLDLNKSEEKKKIKAINNIVNWISNTRTIGGSFLWPMEKNKKGYWIQNPAYNQDRGGSKKSIASKDGGLSYYLQDRSDLTLFEVKNYYSNQDKCNNKLYEGVNGKRKCLFSNIDLSPWQNMKKWLDHFRNFETYVEFFGFKLDGETKSFVNDKYEVRNIFPFKKDEVEYFGEDFCINEYIEKYFNKFNIYNEKQDDYIDKIEKMLNLVTDLIKERSKWMEGKIYMSNIDYKKNENYYNEIVDNCHKNDEAFEMWQDMLNKAIEYTSIRAKWSLMSTEEKIEKDAYRTAFHDSFINSLKIYVRYLKQIGIELLSNELIEQDRKAIGDFANYIVFREAINNR